jgi:hypothetical protein
MKNRASNGLIRFTAISMVFAIILSSSTFVLAASSAKPLSAEIIVSGLNFNNDKASVLLNGERVISGHTFQSAGVISTTENGTALINLGKLGRISLSPNSSLSLNFSENNISGELTSGQIQVLNNEGVTVNIHTPDNEVTNDGQTANFNVDLRSGMTQATIQNGFAYMNKDGARTLADTDPKKDDDDHKKGAWIPILIFAGAVGTVVTLVLLNSRDNDALTVVSPVR